MEVPRLSLRDLAAELIAGRKCGFHPHRGLSRGRAVALEVIAISWETAAGIELDRAVLGRPPIRASPRRTRARPWSNRARVRSTSKLINSAKAGVNLSAFRSDSG